jgi:hypothetical protein
VRPRVDHRQVVQTRLLQADGHVPSSRFRWTLLRLAASFISRLAGLSPPFGDDLARYSAITVPGCFPDVTKGGSVRAFQCVKNWQRDGRVPQREMTRAAFRVGLTGGVMTDVFAIDPAGAGVDAGS